MNNIPKSQNLGLVVDKDAYVFDFSGAPLTRQDGVVISQRGDELMPALPPIRSCLCMCVRTRRTRSCTVQRCKYPFFCGALHSGVHVVRGALTRHRRFLVVASQSGFMPTQTTMPPTGIGGRNHAKTTTYHCTIFVISNSLGHNLSIGTMIFAWQVLFNL